MLSHSSTTNKEHAQTQNTQNMQKHKKSPSFIKLTKHQKNQKTKDLPYSILPEETGLILGTFL
jgi:hypothetical protein